MVKVSKPRKTFRGKILLNYKGTNRFYYDATKFEQFAVIAIDEVLKEELLVKLTMFDGTLIMFSMISNRLYKYENNSYKLKKGQDFCNFQLCYDEDNLIFVGNISYENIISETLNYKEDFSATIILPFSKYVYDIWIIHGKGIIE